MAHTQAELANAHGKIGEFANGIRGLGQDYNAAPKRTQDSPHWLEQW
jgi:hypothetical protein